MKILDPGHGYQVDIYPAKEESKPLPISNRIFFRKRIGEKYPGNEGDSYDGTSTQELLRVIISRAIYVNNQEPHKANTDLIQRSRSSLLDLESRAASRRGDEYLRIWSDEYISWLQAGNKIEEAIPCEICGHIFCQKHKEKDSKLININNLSYQERVDLACQEAFRPNAQKLEFYLKKYNLKLLPGKYNPKMPKEYIQAPIPPDYDPNQFPYPSMIVDENFNL